MKATVKAKSEENNSVLLVDESGAEEWFTLAEHVKMTYVRTGVAEVTVNQEDGLVTFLKMDSPPKKYPQKSGFGKPAQKSFGQNSPKPGEESEERKFYKTKHLVFENLSTEELRTALDLACEQNWVIATQTHFAAGKWAAVVYYKVKPE